MERFAKGHRKTLNELLDTRIASPPPIRRFDCYSLSSMWRSSRTYCSNGWRPRRAWLKPSIRCAGVRWQDSAGLDRSNRFRRSAFHCRGCPYSNTLGVALAQSTYATDVGSGIAALRQLLDRVELEGVLVQADALHANRDSFVTSRSLEPTS